MQMTQPGPYGIPKLTISGKGNTLAYPYKVRVHIIGSYEGRKFLADIGGFDITQKTTYGW